MKFYRGRLFATVFNFCTFLYLVHLNEPRFMCGFFALTTAAGAYYTFEEEK